MTHPRHPPTSRSALLGTRMRPPPGVQATAVGCGEDRDVHIGPQRPWAIHVETPTRAAGVVPWPRGGDPRTHLWSVAVSPSPEHRSRQGRPPTPTEEPSNEHMWPIPRTPSSEPEDTKDPDMAGARLSTVGPRGPEPLARGCGRCRRLMGMGLALEREGSGLGEGFAQSHRRLHSRHYHEHVSPTRTQCKGPACSGRATGATRWT